MRPYIVCIVLLFILCPLAEAADDEFTRESLKGLHGVFVLVERLKAPEEEAGLTEAEIQTDVELKLRLAGIPVLSRAQSLATPGGAFLYINVNVGSSTRNDIWPYNVDIALRQGVTLVRSSETLVPDVTTWDVAGVSAVHKTKVRSIRDDVRDFVDKFINAYLAMNPKR